MVNRAAIRARLVPLASESDDDLSDCTTAAERLALVADLTREVWALSKREVSRSALITNKRETGRLKDLADLEALGELHVSDG